MKFATLALTVLMLFTACATVGATTETKQYTGVWKHSVYGCGPLELSVDTEKMKVKIEIGNDEQTVPAKMEEDVLTFSRYSRERSYWQSYRVGPFPGDTLSGTISGGASSNIKLVAKGGKKPTCQDL